MAISELLRNKLIITYRMRPAHASVLASLLSSDIASYEQLSGFLRRRIEPEDWDAEAAIKAVISRMRQYRPFRDSDMEILNASNVGYYLAAETKKKIFEEIKETANAYTTLA